MLAPMSDLAKKTYQPRNPLKPGEITIKQWKMEMADKLGVTAKAVEQRLSYGSLPYPPCRRVNRRVILVLQNDKRSEPANCELTNAPGATDSPAAPLAVSSGAGLGDGLCPHCQQSVALVKVSCFGRYIVRCNNRKCPVRPRTRTMPNAKDALAVWHINILSMGRLAPETANIRQRMGLPATMSVNARGRSMLSNVESPNDKLTHGGENTKDKL